MANQTVQCPQCGSASCQEYRADSFVCQHCDATFRWINPTQLTVRQQAAHCACGKNAVGCCTQCSDPLCRDHLANWNALFGSWQNLKEIYAEGEPNWRKAARTQGGMASGQFIRPSGWLGQATLEGLNSMAKEKIFIWGLPAELAQPALKRFGFSTPQTVELLCMNCVEAWFVKLLPVVESQIAQLAMTGRLCQLCTEEREQETRPYSAMAYLASHHCHGCGVPVCRVHSNTCSHCQAVWCKKHLPNEHVESCRNCSRISRLMSWFN